MRDQTVIDEVRDRLVGRYARKFRHVARKSLESVANLAVEEALRRYNPKKGAALGTYLYKAINSELWKHCARSWSPVHWNKDYLSQAFKTFALSFDEAGPTGDERQPKGTAFVPPGDDVEPLSATVERARIYRRLRKHIEAQPAGAAALEVLLCDTTVAKAAKAHGLSQSAVKRSTARARASIAQDDYLRAAWASL